MGWTKMHKGHPLRVECLEDRCVPAGNVTANVVGNTLVLFGDSQDNAIKVSSNATLYTVEGQAGTTVNGQASVTIDSSQTPFLDIFISMRQGNDEVYLGGIVLQLELEVPGNIAIDLGCGHDEVLAANVHVGGSTRIWGRAGNDAVAFTNPNPGGPPAESFFDVFVDIDLAQGNDSVLIGGFAVNHIGKRLTIRGGAGSDDVTILDATVGTAVTVWLQAGNDLVNIADTQARKLVIDTAQGSDQVTLTGISIATSATVLLGAGTDILNVGGSIFGSTFFDGGPGTDTFTDSGGNSFGSPSVVLSFP